MKLSVTTYQCPVCEQQVEVTRPLSDYVPEVRCMGRSIDLPDSSRSHGEMKVVTC